ncbi:MAG: hypothetical protein ACOH5I_10100 [Oligoflexus sp.]
MKTYIKLAFALSAVMPLTQVFASDLVKVQSPIEKIYVPRGFTAADQAEVILQGEFPSSCYSTGPATYQVDVQRQEIRVAASSLYDRQSFCLQVMTPFIQPVPLEKVPAGSYDVVLDSDPSVWARIEIEEPELEAPEALYAPVHEAELLISNDGKQSLRIAGELPHFYIGCMVIRDVVVERNQVDMIEVRPLAEIVDGPECETIPDDKKYEIRQGLTEPFTGEGLLHVRGYQGNNFNSLIPAVF